jgi:hypothetical protein
MAAVALDEDQAERVLCFNVLLDESRRDVGVFRHPIYSYAESLAWPPANWRSVCCWHCCHTFDQEPVPLPQAHDRNTDRFSVFGVFCSWPCAKQYQNEHQTWTSGERTLLLEDMAREAFGYNGPPIQAAPPRHRLIMFGGDLSIDAFQQEHAYSNATLRPPLLSFPEIYERAASAGCDGDTAPPPWSVRGLRPKDRSTTAAARTPTAQEGATPSPYERFLSTRQATPGPLASPNAAPSSLRTGSKRSVPGADPGDAGTLQRFLKK